MPLRCIAPPICGAGVVAVAAVAAVGVASAVPSGPARTEQAGGTHPAPRGSAAHSAKTGARASSTGSAQAKQQPLVKLAAYLAAQPAPVGDATVPGQSARAWSGIATLTIGKSSPSGRRGSQ